jgi:hypothetical protein
LAFTNFLKKNITKYQGQGQKGKYKILVVSRDKKGNKLAKKGTILKAFGYEMLAWVFFCWDPPNLVRWLTISSHSLGSASCAENKC